ncbi:hypothetical protein PC129_g14290 [Phytophthora cactorum]|uniref:Uncharacterized protein n=2 Tax=Phytophthora cactorum TaxID=29920 RepID=A0A8T1FCE5_9STRA|nr:hypothetical protein PC111_g16035 [Phytophthora cactorum]KAG2890245.1 hypothetical protein PC114_g17554 [Phytophthora cactorum]KAG2972022.1 hypothetical protein PC118_g15923 [Phytophthora cactorum]KAG3214803.1 hypothetical protein PC129_g14290 [Phytophthora cactorum]KAG4231588.1 hypothetical protein PC116_g20148 [Phytophthora cactorum]
MVDPVGKSPRNKLIPEQRRLCHEAQRRERRARRTQQRELGESNRGSKPAPGKPKPPGTAAAKEVAPPKETIDVSKKKPAAKDVAQDKDEGVPRKKAAAKESEGGARKKKAATIDVAPTHATSPDTVVADMVASVENVATAVPSHPPAPASVGPRPSSRKSNHASDIALYCKATATMTMSEEAEEDNGDAEASTFTIPTSVVDADTNLMVEGVNQCTGLNSNEDPELCEEPEEEEEEDDTGGDDAWYMDWDIGSLTR